MYLLVEPQAPSPLRGVIVKFYQDNKTKKFTKYEPVDGTFELITAEGMMINQNDTAVISTGLRVKMDGCTAVPVSVTPPFSIARIFVADNGELNLVVYNHERTAIFLEAGDPVAVVVFVDNVTFLRVNTVKDLE